VQKPLRLVDGEGAGGKGDIRGQRAGKPEIPSSRALRDETNPKSLMQNPSLLGFPGRLD